MAQYPRIEWDDFLRRFRWQQGEHVIAVSPTGGGKTTLFARLLERRLYTIVFVTKLYDVTITNEFRGYKVIRNFSDIKKVEVGQPNRYLLWPKPGVSTADTMAIQRRTFADAFDRVYLERGWTVLIDEEHYVCDMLHLDAAVKLYLHQARSSKISLVNGTQRPAYVPVVSYSGSSHAFVWRTTRKLDMDKVCEFGGANDKELRENVVMLDEHEFVYLNSRDPNAQPVITQVRL